MLMFCLGFAACAVLVAVAPLVLIADYLRQPKPHFHAGPKDKDWDYRPKTQSP